MSTGLPTSIDATAALLEQADYLADRSLATAIFLAVRLGRPLLLEGEPGTGKTEVAKALGPRTPRSRLANTPTSEKRDAGCLNFTQPARSGSGNSTATTSSPAASAVS